MEISIKHLEMSLSFPFGLLYLPKLFKSLSFPKISTSQCTLSLQNPLFKSIEKTKNHSSKGGSPASSFLTLFRGP